MKLDKQKVESLLYALLRKQNVADEDQGLLLVSAISKGIAYSLQLPATPVQSVRAYYAETVEPVALSVLSDINEHVVFNGRLAKEMVFQIYRARYSVLHSNFATDLHPLVDALVAADKSRSLEPKLAGIFERVVADKAGHANVVAWAIHDELTTSFQQGDE